MSIQALVVQGSLCGVVFGFCQGYTNALHASVRMVAGGAGGVLRAVWQVRQCSCFAIA